MVVDFTRRSAEVAGDVTQEKPGGHRGLTDPVIAESPRQDRFAWADSSATTRRQVGSQVPTRS
jgi:hypothetical protein